MFPFTTLSALAPTAIDLGSPTDWTVVVGLVFAAVALAGAVWKLAVAATNVEHAVKTTGDKLAEEIEHSHARYQELTKRYDALAAQFAAYQRDQTKIMHDLQATVNHLTWKVANLDNTPDPRKRPGGG